MVNKTVVLHCFSGPLRWMGPYSWVHWVYGPLYTG